MSTTDEIRLYFLAGLVALGWATAGVSGSPAP